MLKNIIQKYWPIVFILIVWFLFSSPYVLNGLVPFPSTYQVNHFPPWSSLPELWGPVKNGAMPDIIDQIYPWRHLAIEIWKSGQIPLWNPYNFSGNPHLANFQSAVLSPFNILFFILPFIDAWSILILLQPLFVGLFTFLFLRRLQLSKVGSALSSVTFMLCGFVVTWMEYGTLSLAISFLPLALLVIETYYQTKKNRYLILLSLTFPLSFFSGHFQTSVYFALFVGAYLVFKGVVHHEKRSFLLLVFYILLGILLTLPQILPSIEFYLYSVRSEIFNSGGGTPWFYLVTVFSPDFFGNPVTLNNWFGFYAEWASFIGIIPLSLALVAIFSRKNSYVWFFMILGISTLLLSLDTPLQNLIGILKIPVLSTSYPSRIIVLFSFSFAVLAGFGFDVLINNIRKKNIKNNITPILFSSLLMGSAWIAVFTLSWVSPENLQIAKKNLILPTIILGVFIVIVIGMYMQKKLLVILSFLLIAIAGFDSYRFANKWMPFETREKVFITIPVIEAMKREIKNDRYLGNLGAQIASYYNLSSLDGYDPLYIKRYGEFIRSASTGEFIPAERSVVKMPRIGDNVDRVLDLLGASLIFHPIGDTNQSWAYPVWEKGDRVEKIYQDAKFQLYKNKKSLSRVQLFFSYEVIQDDKKTIKRFFDPKFDFRNVLILNSHVAEEIKGGRGDAHITKDSPNSVKIRTKSENSAILFLADNYYPGWIAFVDKIPVHILRANYSFRALVVPGGTHEVEFKYEPKSFQYGLEGAALGLVSLVGISIWRKKLTQLF